MQNFLNALSYQTLPNAICIGVYTPLINERLKYTCQFIFNQVLKVNFELITNETEFIKRSGFKINFSNQDFKNTYKIWGWFFRVSGKISVTGNAMSRIYFKSNGKIAVNNLKLKVSFDTILIRTITGCSNVFLYFLYK